MSQSDFQCLARLKLGKTLSSSEIYKACVALANNGLRREEEQSLHLSYRQLLEARRFIKKGDYKVASHILKELHVQAKDFLIAGDREFLRGMILHREGNMSAAAQALTVAAQHFKNAREDHRHLRALINSFICQSDNVDIYNAGELFAFQQLATRKKYFDLAGNIQRARAGELLSAGKFEEAAHEALESVKNYEKDGCPEDLAVAYMMAAIAQAASGDTNAAQKTYKHVLIRDGKVKSYVTILEALQSGKIPKVYPGHPLEKTPWKGVVIKTGSLSGKILSRLKIAPISRDELISEIWGTHAIHPSYCARLYTAINYIRKSKGISVLFDGDKYRLT